MSQIGRNLTDAIDGIMRGKRYLIHDRDPLFTSEFLTMLADVGVKSVKLPPRNHQGLGNRLIMPDEPHAAHRGPLRRRERLGGMLNYYYRAAA